MIRYHEAAYDRVLSGLGQAARRTTEGIFSGLRFVRNWMGFHADPADFIQPQPGPDGGEAPIAAWTWNSLPALQLGAVAPGGRRWEAARYRHYSAYLARQPVGDTMTRTATFLNNISVGT